MSPEEMPARVQIRLPRSAHVVFNHLFSTNDPAYLTQDLLAIELPDRRYIDVGWFPEGDPNGAFTITVFQKTWDNREFEIETKDIDEVVNRVEILASDTVTWISLSNDLPNIHFLSGTQQTYGTLPKSRRPGAVYA